MDDLSIERNGGAKDMMIKSWKFIAAIAAAGTLIVSDIPTVAAGTDQKVVITAWEGAGGESGKFLQSLVNSYNQSQSKVEVKLVYVDTNDMVQKLTAAAAGNALPDVGMLMWPQWAAPLKQIILPLDSYIKKYPKQWDEKDFLPKLLNGNVRFKGVTYGVPIETNNLALYYNKKLFAQAHLQPPKTWDQLIQDAKKLTNPSKHQWGLTLPTQAGGNLDWIWDTFLWQAGGQYANAAGTKLMFDSPAGVKATQLWVDLVRKYKVMSLSPPQNGFQTGLIAMQLDGPYDIPNLNSTPNLDYGIAPLPAGPGGKATNIGGTNNFIFKTDSQHEQAAWNFLMWLASPNITAKFAAGYGSIPVRKSSSNTAVWKAFVKKNPGVEVHVKSYSFGKYRPYQMSTYDQISDIVSTQVEAAMQGAETAKQAMDKAYQQARPLVQSW